MGWIQAEEMEDREELIAISTFSSPRSLVPNIALFM
jgi:hypothetical protein